jgi:hypothetical protein
LLYLLLKRCHAAKINKVGIGAARYLFNPKFKCLSFFA